MPRRGTETDFELATIERLERLDYHYCHADELQRAADEVVLLDVLRARLQAFYPALPDTAIDEAVKRLSRPDGVDVLRRNRQFHRDCTRGFELSYEQDDGSTAAAHLYPIQWQDVEANEFLVVNQLAVHGVNDRRPDLVVYINGLPLVLFELKSPYLEKPTIAEAHNQIAHYRHHIPQLFEFNALVVLSDGNASQHGMWTADLEWFAPWKSIDGELIEPETTGSMKSLIEGLFDKRRLLDYIRHFVLFESVEEKITKKGAKYHQYFAVRKAVERCVLATQSKDKRIGVIWHTTGSGKSLSMMFMVALLRKHPALSNPSFVIQVDRTDLDNQLHDQFVAARDLVGDVLQAQSVNDLRSSLRTEGGEVVFSTIEKFRLQKDKNNNKETRHPVLSQRDNILVIADEAHRTQYGFEEGFARYLAEALPNAKRIGFTGTPISFSGADTTQVFGDYIHTYDIRQGQQDGATVKIHYLPRQIKLSIDNPDVDIDFDDIIDGADDPQLERKKSRWTALAKAAGAKDRVQELAQSLLTHYLTRSEQLLGKAMVVCMTRENCVKLYDALTALPGCPEVKVVMTANLNEDPEAWSQAGHISTKGQREAIKERMRDIDDPLKIVIVCDMWLTGTDIPCLHTLYIDKPMKGHNIIQAISRVNRVFRDKPHGLIVDYIGIGDELRDATNTYTRGGGKGNPAPDLDEEAIPLFFAVLEDVRALLPEGIDYGDWRSLGAVELDDRRALVYGHLMQDDDRRDAYLQAELKLSKAFLLVKQEEACMPLADEVLFYQLIRNGLRKTFVKKRTAREIETAVLDLVDNSIASSQVEDVFAAAGIEEADISILDDDFLQTFKDKPLPDLRLRLLEKLLKDEIAIRQRRNIATARSFSELLENTLRKYHSRLIDAAAVIRAMMEIRQEMQREAERAQQLGLDEEELAFYDVVHQAGSEVYDDRFLCDVIHDVVQAIKRNLKVDWTEPHREDIKAAVRSAVRNVLRKKGIKERAEQDNIIQLVFAQAEQLYKNWPVAA